METTDLRRVPGCDVSEYQTSLRWTRVENVWYRADIVDQLRLEWTSTVTRGRTSFAIYVGLVSLAESSPEWFECIRPDILNLMLSCFQQEHHP